MQVDDVEELAALWDRYKHHEARSMELILEGWKLLDKASENPEKEQLQLDVIEFTHREEAIWISMEETAVLLHECLERISKRSDFVATVDDFNCASIGLKGGKLVRISIGRPEDAKIDAPISSEELLARFSKFRTEDHKDDIKNLRAYRESLEQGIAEGNNGTN